MPIRSPGSATMFRSQASKPVVADQWCLSKHHSGAKRSGSSSSNCGVLGSLPPGKLTRREGTSGFQPYSPAQHVAVFLPSDAYDSGPVANSLVSISICPSTDARDEPPTVARLSTESRQVPNDPINLGSSG